eukprot:Clim_evm50s144 gene=Clim_evmTU50s144
MKHFEEAEQHWYWGPRTAYLDWCEFNYRVTHYIAEFWNTITNLSFMALAIYGMFEVRRLGLETRFDLAYLAILITGAGSAWFHGTLSMEGQMMDEFPMIFTAAAFLFCSVSYKDPPNAFSDRSKKWAVGLVAYVVVSWAGYMYLEISEFFFVCYGIGVVLLAYQGVDHTKTKKMEDARRLMYYSVSAYGTGFLLWNIDNIFCEELRALRAEIEPFGPFLELHAWWHCLTGYGSYGAVVLLSVVRVRALKRTDAKIVYRYGLIPTMELPKGPLIKPKKASTAPKSSTSNVAPKKSSRNGAASPTRKSPPRSAKKELEPESPERVLPKRRAAAESGLASTRKTRGRK